MKRELTGTPADPAEEEGGERKRAIALRYADEDNAPRIVASGVGEVAKRLVLLAAEHGVPVQRDDTLVEILKKLPLGYEIPPEAYRLVAELLAWLFRTDLEWRKAQEGRSSALRR